MKKGGAVLFLVLLIVVVALAMGLYGWRMLPSHRVLLEPGTEARFDDFAFAVTGSRLESALGFGSPGDGAPGGPAGAVRVEPRGRFVILELRVANHAQRVDFTFRPETVRLIDTRGDEHALSPEGQAALQALGRTGCRDPLPAGGACDTELAFDVPTDAIGGDGDLRARLSFGGGILDALDVLLYGNRLLRVP